MTVAVLFPKDETSQAGATAPDAALREADSFIVANLAALTLELLNRRAGNSESSDSKLREVAAIIRKGGFQDTHTLTETAVIRVALEHTCGQRFPRGYDKA